MTRVFQSLFGSQKVKVKQGSTTEYNSHIQSIVNKGFNYFDVDKDYISTFVTCSKILASNISKLDFVLLKAGEKIEDHNLNYLLNYKVNNYTNSTNFFETLELHRNQFGNSFARIYRTGLGEVKSLEVIHPSYIVGYKIVRGGLYFMYVDENERKQTVNYQNLLHFKTVSSDDKGIFGLNIKDVLLKDMELIYNSKTGVNNEYENGLGLSSKYIKTDVVDFSEDSVREAISQLKSNYQNKNDVPFLPDGWEIVNLSDSKLIDSEVLSLLKVSKEEIASFFQIPFAFITNNSAQNFEQSMLSFKVNTLQSIFKLYEAELNNKLFTKNELIKEKFKIKFDLSRLDEVDTKTNIEKWKSLWMMGVATGNQIAKEFNLPEYEAGKEHLLQAQYIKAGEENNQQEEENPEK